MIDFGNYEAWLNAYNNAKDKNLFIEESFNANPFVGPLDPSENKECALYYLHEDAKSWNVVEGERYIRFRLWQVAQRRYEMKDLYDERDVENVDLVRDYNHDDLCGVMKKKQREAEQAKAEQPKVRPKQAKAEQPKVYKWKKEELIGEPFTANKNVPFTQLFKFLRDNKIIAKDEKTGEDEKMDAEYFKEAVKKAQYGKMYEWAVDNNAAQNFRAWAHGLARKYYDNGYTDHTYSGPAAKSMGLTYTQFAKYNTDNKFYTKLKKILDIE